MNPIELDVSELKVGDKLVDHGYVYVVMRPMVYEGGAWVTFDQLGEVLYFGPTEKVVVVERGAKAERY